MVLYYITVNKMCRVRRYIIKVIKLHIFRILSLSLSLSLNGPLPYNHK